MSNTLPDPRIHDAYLKLRMDMQDDPDSPFSRDSLYREVQFIQRKGRRKKLRKTYTPSDSTLAKVQRTIAEIIPSFRHPAVCSYEKKDSVIRCAEVFSGCSCIGAMDITNYFPSITQDVVAYTIALALSERGNMKGDISGFARVVAWLCTKSSPVDPGCGTAVLPLGIKPAPAISNIACFEIDKKIDAYVNERGLLFRRYSDNIYIGRRFPGRENKLDREGRAAVTAEMSAVLDDIREIFLSTRIPGLDGPGVILQVNEEKCHIMPYWRQQRVLGVVVNDGQHAPMVSREYVRSAFSHLSSDTTDLLAAIENAYLNNQRGNIEYLTTRMRSLAREYRKTDGYLNWMSAINSDDRMRLMTQRGIVKMALAESQRILRAIEEVK